MAEGLKKKAAPKFFIGIDISKLTLDFAIIHNRQLLEQVKIANTEADIKQLVKRFSTDYKCIRGNSLYCAEHMGIYATFLLNVCLQKKLTICMESPLQIKQSLGIQRGKNDAIDSIRIAKYAGKNHLILKPWRPPRPELEQLKFLSSLRKRLIKSKVMISQNQKTEAYYLSKHRLKEIGKYTGTGIKAIQGNIEAIEQEMRDIIRGDEKLNRLMDIITSVPGIGEVIGSDFLICTNEFNEIWTAKKFASYCGVAPFERTSGTSIKGKSRVSHIANKNLKSLLHMAALGTVRNRNTFLGLYYQRKVEEGKNKMSILNAIRNKLIHRVFSCVRNNKPFEELKIS